MDIKHITINDVSLDVYKDDKVFGDGEHESTKFMLSAIERYGVKDKTVIDVGTGTGILSIFAKLSGASHVLALDIDAHSLEYARKNFKRNNVDVDVEINDLVRCLDDKADVVLANLPGHLQTENIKLVDKNLNDDGLFICTWWNKIPFEDFTFYLNWEVVERFEGEDYDGYVLRQRA